MLTGLIKKVFGDKNTRALKELWPIVDLINEEYDKIKEITDEELKEKTAEFKQRIDEENRKEESLRPADDPENVR